MAAFSEFEVDIQNWDADEISDPFDEWDIPDGNDEPSVQYETAIPDVVELDSISAPQEPVEEEILLSNDDYFVKPYAWSAVVAKSDSKVRPAIQIFGHILRQVGTSETIYLRVYLPKIYLVRIIDGTNMIAAKRFIQARFNYESVSSPRDPQVLMAFGYNDLAFLDIMDREAQLLDSKYPNRQFTEYLRWFFSVKNIRPYDPLIVTSPKFLRYTNYTRCQVEAVVEYPQITQYSLPVDVEWPIVNRIYYDIEVLSTTKNFVDARIPGDIITNISCLTIEDGEKRGYMIDSLGPLPTIGPYNHPVEMNLIDKSSETECLMEFAQLWRQLLPGFQIHYNGDHFDKPYIIDRVNGKDVEFQASVPRLGNKIKFYSYPSPFIPGKLEFTKEYILPDCNDVDLIHYFRRFHPGFPNYRLETVAQKFLGLGKVDISIDKFFEIVEKTLARRNGVKMSARSIQLLTKIIDYSYTDTLLLEELDTKLAIIETLEKIANAVGITIESVLRMSERQLIRNIFGSIDFAYLTYDFAHVDLPKMSRPKPGYYIEVTEYDLTEAILAAFVENLADPTVSQIYSRVRYFPGILLLKVASCLFTPRAVRNSLEAILKKFNKKLIGIIGQKIFFEDGREREFLSSPIEYKTLLVTENSHIALTQKDVVEFYGRSNLTRPKFPLMASLAKTLLKEVEIYGKFRFSRYAAKTLDKHPIRSLCQSVKIYNKKYVQSNPLRESLIAKLAERGVEITSWIVVRYLMLENGEIAILLNDADYRQTYPIDRQYYIQQLNSFIREMISYKIHK